MASILEMILYDELQSDIGLNLLKEFGFVSFGMRDRNVVFVHSPIFAFE